MDEGSVGGWPERFNYDELSGIQHAMNLRLQDEAAFYAECQNEQLHLKTIVEGMLSADETALKIKPIKRGGLSIGCNHQTAFIYIQQKLLFYMIVGWEDDFTVYGIDYRSYPGQKRS